MELAHSTMPLHVACSDAPCLLVQMDTADTRTPRRYLLSVGPLRYKRRGVCWWEAVGPASHILPQVF